jgi:hypothetical protein
MRFPDRLCTSVLGLLGWLVTADPARGQRGPGGSPAAAKVDLAGTEEKAIARQAEQVRRAADNERARWLKELNAAFPGKVGPGRTEEDFAQWFGLLARGGSVWRRADSPTPRLAELYDRAVRRLELGPVPAIQRDEFVRYARRSLRPDRSPPDSEEELHEEADELFRILDRNGDTVLGPTEWTPRLRLTAHRADARRVDADGNGRINRTEYRAYFGNRVATVAAQPAPPESNRGSRSDDRGSRSDDRRQPPPARPGPPAGDELPGWFTELDTDADGQVGLYEWRADGRPMPEFMTMDLDDDGLLPPGEYLRFVRLTQPEMATEPPTRPASASNDPRGKLRR